jgi:colanic acid/amylovoran biosynthesis protein
MSSPPPVRIGLLWHSATSGNLGVGALTVANMAIVAQAARDVGLEPHFTLLSMRDGDCPPLVGDDVPIVIMTMRSLLDPRQYKAVVRGLDVVIDIGAGDSFADIYGAKRFFMIWMSKWIAVRSAKPLILAPQTIGPFTRAPYIALAACIMNRALAVVARDRQSLKVAQKFAPKTQSLLAADVAFSLPFTNRSAERGGARPRVGVNVSGLLFAQAESGENRFGLSIDYAAFVRGLIAALLARGDVEVLLITHAISGGDASDDDDAIADRMAAEFPAAVRVPSFTHPSEAKSFISSLDLLVASRMHACIGAFSAGVPVMPVAYSRKFDGVFGLLGYAHGVPVTGLDADSAIARVLDALDRRDALAADIARGMTEVDALLENYRALLRTTLKACVPPMR